MSTMIESHELSKSFGSIRAVDKLSFTVGKGEVLGFLGPNGAGKSTTMKILTCFLAPDGGTAKICGHDILEDPMAVRRSIGYLPETAPAYGEMTVTGFLQFCGRIRGLRGAGLTKAIDRVVEMCNLGRVRYQSFETLSKGFKRRTSLAQALIHDPPVLVMDEPTDGLDPNQKHEVRRLIEGMAKDKCIILSTHILEEVDAVCTRALIIAGGRLVVDGKPDELKRRAPGHGRVTLEVRGADSEAVLAALRGIPDVEKASRVERAEADGTAHFEVIPRQGRTVLPQVVEQARAHNWQIEDLHAHPGQLDDIFRELTNGGGHRS